jgi:hypothetical protein
MPGALPVLFRLLPELPGLAGTAGPAADVRQPSRDVLGFPYSGNGVATAQDLFRPRVVLCLAGTVGRVTVGPADPSPSPRRDRRPATTGTTRPPSADARPASQSCSPSRSLTTSSADSAPSHSPASFSRSASTPRPRSLASRSSLLMPVSCDRSGLPLSATRRRMPSSRTISSETTRSSVTQDIFTPWCSLTSHPPSAGRRRSTPSLSAAARAASGRGRRSPGGGRHGRSRRRFRTRTG